MFETPDLAERRVTGAVVDESWDVDREWLDEWSFLYVDESGPRCYDDPEVTDEELLGIRGEVSEWDVPLLASIDPTTLNRDGQADYLRRVDAVEAMVAAMRARAVLAMAGSDRSDSTADRHAAMEVALLCRVGEGSATSSIATARSLHSDFPGFLKALGAGEVSDWHCRELVSGTRHVTDPETLMALQARLLPKAKRRTPGQFRTDVRKAVADLDAAKAAERTARARENRYVSCRPLEDGLGYLGLVTDWPTVQAMHATITADGRSLRLQRGGARAARRGDDDALADACRADAFAARVLGTVAGDGSVSWERTEAQVSLTVVMDLETLRGEADRHALLDGEAIPAGIAREYADVAATWRRAVTDPVTGHLLDYGTEQYLPEKLRRYVLARDLCRAPGCTRHALSSLEMDHAVPFPEGGTSAAECGGLCRLHHRLKTLGRADIDESAADGSAIWTTAWGQRIRIDPRPFLHDPGDHPRPEPEPRVERPTSPAPAAQDREPDPPDEPPPF